MAKAYNIIWDIDDEDDVDLPSEIEIPPGITDDEAISDFITDLTGYCHKGYVLSTDGETHNVSVRLGFKWDDHVDYQEYMLTVPMDTTVEDVYDILQEEHLRAYDDENDIYAEERSPYILIEHVANKYGWSFEEFTFDIDAVF